MPRMALIREAFCLIRVNLRNPRFLKLPLLAEAVDVTKM